MKTKEFVEKVNKLGYDCSIQGHLLYVFEGHHSIACISLCETSYFTMQEGGPELCKLCIEYAQTPLEERKDEKKYYLKKKELKFYEIDDENRYLNLGKENNIYFISNKNQDEYYTTQFTQEKIDWIKERFDTDLEEFKQIEV